jgi:hypothetical protein
LRAAFAEFGSLHNAERQAAGGELFHGAAGMNDERRIVTGVEKR